MTDHPSFKKYRITTDHGPLSPAGTENTVTALAGRTGTPNPRRGPGWSALAAIVAGAVLAVEAGVLVFDANTEPTAPATVETVEYSTAQRMVQESIDEALAANAAPAPPGTGAVSRSGSPDGYLQLTG